MLPTPINYAVRPAVVPVDRPTRMTILPTERAFLFVEDKEYCVKVIPIDADEENYYQPATHRSVTAVGKNGVLCFDFTFEEEQEYLLRLFCDEVQLCELPLYALREDLYGLRPLRGDFHGHSFRSDGRRDPAALLGHYREQGYDFMTLTDHNRFYPGDEIEEAYTGVKLGIVRVPGEEVHSPESVVHIVHAGGRESVDEQYVMHREEYDKKVEECLGRVPAYVPEALRCRYAKAMWATEAIHAAGGIAIFPHPYWQPNSSKCYNVKESFTKIFLTSGMFDAYELIGGQDNNLSVALWSELRAEGLRLPVVGSSDVHRLLGSSVFPHCFTICFAKEKTVGAIVDAVRQGLSVAVEGEGTEYTRTYRCYGSLRLVHYARFLLKAYFPVLQRVCQGEGVSMRAYVMGEVGRETVETQAEQGERFALRFFGQMEPVLPDAAMLDFEARWRARQMEGPMTKGGSIAVDTKGPTMQI